MIFTTKLEQTGVLPTYHVEKEVGDGTTSAVLLSNEIFGKLCDWDDEESASPYEINREFINVINMIMLA